MADGLVADIERLEQMAATMRRISDRMRAVDSKDDFHAEDYGPGPLLPALGKFVNGWKDGRRQINDGIKSNADTLADYANKLRELENTFNHCPNGAPAGPTPPAPQPGGTGGGTQPGPTGPAGPAAVGAAGAGGAVGNGWGAVSGTPPPALNEYQRRALDRAGIDITDWDPSKGLGANRDIVRRVYDYYADLYAQHPELEWLGMAAMVGAAFFAGFDDLEDMKGAVRVARAILDGPLGSAGLPGELEASLRVLANMSDSAAGEELRWYQQQFLRMQREIFLDMAGQHEAYLAGGLDAIRSLLRDDPYRDRTINAWEKIDEGRRNGDPRLIEQGTLGLADREQRFVIADDYDRMRTARPTGEALTYLMTVVGTPSIRGSHSFAQRYPLTLDPFDRVPLPHGKVVTPLPDGNISDVDDRWKLFVNDTAPAYFRLSPEERRATVAVPIEKRMQAFKLSNRVGDLIRRLTAWRVEFG